MKSVSGYDRLAWIYDLMASIVFGGAIQKAQEYHLSEIRSSRQLLIIGGGTGKILQHIEKSGFKGSISFLDSSCEMVNRAKKKGTSSDVQFHLCTIEEWETPLRFDAIILPFFLDQFEGKALRNIIKKIAGLAKKGAVLICVDFQLKDKWWQHFLLKSMYIFFHRLTSIDAGSLTDPDELLAENGWVLEKQQAFYGQFIYSKVYS
ncbi:MAG: class I SAM-dependent methyltransferase [Cyclobacteriaceae bacterium]|nr:class I SAM-dependent methyltransferase [Cyclobacteriaceae bacterium]